jgi:DNA mismatch endonuclease (patch repair protein)
MGILVISRIGNRLQGFNPNPIIIKRPVLEGETTTDIFSKEKRSKIMSSIRSKDTTIEKKVGLLLKKNKIKFKKNPRMVGNPDFVITGKKVAIFCDGDFWHGRDYKARKKELSEFWRKKIERNMERDKETNRRLRKDGWGIIRLWECDINNSPEKCVRKILSSLGR